MKTSPGHRLNILVLEPYYGGSHKDFLKGLREHVMFNFELMTLPARKWKWRMRLSAPYYANKLKHSGKQYDRILCSTFVDVATFRGMAPGWVKQVPLLTYFHENQFVYPVQVDDERDFHFALTNLTTALASDRIAFNSTYNLETFLTGTENLIKKSYDLKLTNVLTSIKAKAHIIPPGLDFSTIDKAAGTPGEGPPVIIWNHRWEHDKNPDLFFTTLFDLDRSGIDFRLIVLGESFKDHPSIFEKAQKRLSRKIVHAGYVRSKREYATLLKKGDIVVSTANHEFFGMSVIEAVRAGCRPLLPNRLSYPELFPEKYLYKDNSLQDSMKNALLNPEVLSPSNALKLTQPYSWDSLSAEYESWISG